MFPNQFGLNSKLYDPAWFGRIAGDPACLHFTMFIASTYIDHIQGRSKQAGKAQAHFNQTLHILQNRLAHGSQDISASNSTILVVIGLTFAATILGDLDAAQNHIRGLYSIVSLRGGLRAFHKDKQIQAKICR